jgi:hypothetical protein
MKILIGPISDGPYSSVGKMAVVGGLTCGVLLLRGVVQERTNLRFSTCDRGVVLTMANFVFCLKLRMSHVIVQRFPHFILPSNITEHSCKHTDLGLSDRDISDLKHFKINATNCV